VARRIESRAEELDTARRLGKAARPSREAAQRSLLLAAMTEAAAAKGYKACRVEDVLERSGLSRSSFYLHFTDKAECFMAAFEVAVGGLLTAASEAAESAAEPESRIWAGVSGVVDRLGEGPAAAQLALVEIRTAGAEGQKRFEAACKRFASLMAGGHCLPVAPGMKMEAAERAVGAITTVLWLEIGAGHTENLRRLVPALVAAVMRMSAPDRGIGRTMRFR
jgi:AcrR family transcriptional regulator